MIQLSISNWRECPSDAHVRGLVLGGQRITADSSLEALVEFCKYAERSNGSAMGLVMRSGKFKDWLGYDGRHIPKPVKCSFAIYVSSSDSNSINFMRISLLAEALGISSQCDLLYKVDESFNEDNIHATEIVRKALFRSGDEEMTEINPLAMVIGLSKIPVSSWNECIPAYIHYIKTSMPFGESVASKLKLPFGYELFDSSKCIQTLKTLVDDSGLDRYSVYIEYDTTRVGSDVNVIESSYFADIIDDFCEEDVARIATSAIATGGRSEETAVNPVATSVLARKFRHFAPGVSIW